MKQNGNKGFTLIELLVVIAIIGILASVVLASLNSARAKGKDAAIKAQLSSMRAEAELLYDSVTPNSYDLVCTSNASPIPNPSKLYDAASAQSPGTGLCTASTTTWAAYIPLNNTTNGSDYCVDSSGYAGYGTGTTVCTP